MSALDRLVGEIVDVDNAWVKGLKVQDCHVKIGAGIGSDSQCTGHIFLVTAQSKLRSSRDQDVVGSVVALQHAANPVRDLVALIRSGQG